MEAGATRGAAAALKIGDQMFVDLSAGAREDLGLAPTPIHPEVQSVLDSIPEASREAWHGGCAEVGCISRALNAGHTVEDLANGEIAASSIRTGGLPKAPCMGSCAPMLNTFKIKY